MPLAERGWNDARENYLDSYTLSVVGTTATAINSSGNSPYLNQPIVVFGITVTVNPAVGSGDVSFHDVTASGDASAKYRVNVASAASQTFSHVMSFPRGLVFDKGVMVSANSVTGSINVLYRNRFG